MEKTLENWGERSEPSKTRITLYLIAGVVTFIAGFGAWKSPRLDWDQFIQTFIQFFKSFMEEASRMFGDPFSFVGFTIMIVGFIVIITSSKKLFKF